MMTKVVLLLTIASLIATIVMAIDCPAARCSPDDPLGVPLEMSTSDMSILLSGQTLKFYSLQPNGTPYLRTYSSISMDSIGEIKLKNNETCENTIWSLEELIAEQRVARYLEFEMACCQYAIANDILAPGVARSMISVNVTYPDWPEFWIELLFSTVNQTHHLSRPPTPEIGSGYNISYEYELFRFKSVTFFSPLLHLFSEAILLQSCLKLDFKQFNF
jgi:hypothetical protein